MTVARVKYTVTRSRPSGKTLSLHLRGMSLRLPDVRSGPNLQIPIHLPISKGLGGRSCKRLSAELNFPLVVPRFAVQETPALQVDLSHVTLPRQNAIPAGRCATLMGRRRLARKTPVGTGLARKGFHSPPAYLVGILNNWGIKLTV